MIVVAVLTYQRNALLSACIDSLVALDADSPAFRVLIVDNDPAAGARDLADHITDRRIDPVGYVHEPKPGIAAARNAAVRWAIEHSAEWIAFIDDDETATPRWLIELHAAAAPGHDGAQGPVFGRLEPGGPNWASSFDGFHKAVGPRGTQLVWASTSNLLLRLEPLAQLPEQQWFRIDLGLTGGSDAELTARLVKSGIRIVCAPEAIVTETVPLARQSARWLRKRRRRTAAVHAHIRRTILRPRFVLAGLVRDAAKSIVGGAARWLLGVAGRSELRRVRGLLKISWGVGLLSGTLARIPEEYLRDNR